jgi:RNA polymerase subunit RPABC4/transcription elongation factor Spt4
MMTVQVNTMIIIQIVDKEVEARVRCNQEAKVSEHHWQGLVIITVSESSIAFAKEIRNKHFVNVYQEAFRLTVLA